MIVNIILIAIAVVALIAIRLFPAGDTADFPSVLAWAILILSVIDLLANFLKKKKIVSENSDGEVFDNRSWIMTISTLVYLIVMPHLGFVFSSGILCAIVLKAQGATTWLRALAFGFALAMIIYFVFAKLMNVALPIGILN